MEKKVVIKKIKVLKFELKLETGLHIGGNKDNYGIGGVDSPVIKNPLNNQPIIPGSSLKGKIRSLMEIVDNGVYSCEENKQNVIYMFGPSPEKEKDNTSSSNKIDEKEKDPSLTRIIFRDLSLKEESAKELQVKLGEGFFTEIKAENFIEKLKCSANPRFQERVPAGAIFEGECIINYQDYDQVDFEELLKTGFKLLENNYLGGSGSRGYGKVSVKFL